MNPKQDVLIAEDSDQGTHAKRLIAYMCEQASIVYREPQGCLKHPFLVPGGLFQDELWDWDCFWIAEGLAALKDEMSPAGREEFVRYTKGSLINFFEHQSADGTIPIMVKATDGDRFGCTTPGGTEKNQAKPVLAQFASRISTFTEDFLWLEPYYESLKKFNRRWRSKYGVDCGLLVWGSDVAIGVDNDPTTYGRPEFSSANLLLNCLYHQELFAMVKIATELGRLEDIKEFQSEVSRIEEAIQAECWDPIDGFFYTVDVQCEDLRHVHFPQIKRGMDMPWKTIPLKIKLFTGFLPMWCGIASPEQVKVLVEKHLRNPAEFNARHGIRSMAKNEKMYDPGTDSANPSNWLGPIWIVANYMIHEGLKRYGYHKDAAEITEKMISLLGEDLQRNGYLHECYHPDSAAPNFNKNFLSWNVLVGPMAKGLAQPAVAS
ncbi:MAG TPA: trehalase family glycosidase [Rariglobus sp.]|nr:trehalase family glycosidase [Rariglobus sp.]